MSCSEMILSEMSFLRNVPPIEVILSEMPLSGMTKMSRSKFSTVDWNVSAGKCPQCYVRNKIKRMQCKCSAGTVPNKPYGFGGR